MTAAVRMGSTSAGARPARAVSPIHLPNAKVFLIHSALGQAWADDTYAALMTGVSWRTASIQMFGRQIPSPRLTAWVGDHAYTYSRLTWPPAPWGISLRAIRQRVEELTGTSFNGVLLNLYRDGYDSMGWHSDDEPELGRQPVIASLSLGAPRRFVFRALKNHAHKFRLILNHDSLLIMSGETQSHWQHALPKTTKPVAARINLTFRWVDG